MPPRLYAYVGPPGILARAARPAGWVIADRETLLRILTALGPPNAEGLSPATFVVLPAGQLVLGERGREHVACAAGGPVRAAGELFLTLEEPNSPVVVEASNQSTGYVPEPSCWPEVARALDEIRIPHPGKFTLALLFSRCPNCGQCNVVRDEHFACAVCEAELPREWNF